MPEQPAPGTPDSVESVDGGSTEEIRREGMEFADASVWLSRISTAIAPGLIGLWLDDHYGTKYFALIGLVLGLTSGTLSFIQATKGVFKKPGKSTSPASPSKRSLP
jgi:F0F1-type ATP synthase assembly protein I